jgi:hypothetical protein
MQHALTVYACGTVFHLVAVVERVLGHLFGVRFS